MTFTITMWRTGSRTGRRYDEKTATRASSQTLLKLLTECRQTGWEAEANEGELPKAWVVGGPRRADEWTLKWISTGESGVLEAPREWPEGEDPKAAEIPWASLHDPGFRMERPDS